MKSFGLVAVISVGAALSACTTFNPHRRTMTDWNVSMLKAPVDPCGSMPAVEGTGNNGQCGGNAEGAGRRAIDAIFVKPIAFAMMPISWATDTLILNPIDGYKKAELEVHERRFCETESHPEWSDAHAAHHAYGAVPVATPWVISEALALPEFAARWVWNSVYPTSPVDQDAYNQYWREHNEVTGR
ncbi:MAG: hypothetical protein K8T90_21440 [Planctomycetes bacterium]|nr:hypothetical protein [Planctomycetota bacterium]